MLAHHSSDFITASYLSAESTMRTPEVFSGNMTKRFTKRYRRDITCKWFQSGPQPLDLIGLFRCLGAEISHLLQQAIALNAPNGHCPRQSLIQHLPATR